eukprot:1191231-Prorocentrum_minimum.AAC.1
MPPSHLFVSSLACDWLPLTCECDWLPLEGSSEVDLNAQVARWVEYILAHQSDRGWLGPDDGYGGPGNVYWTGWNTAIALLQYAEAREHAGDPATAARCNRAVKP